ncbi:twitchin-like [Tachypleus tridentatus]|uniref:twitchin-like n=1 Tax=Tachypleus tridentatus TaxID=6853 RepID=UPI003FD084CF
MAKKKARQCAPGNSTQCNREGSPTVHKPSTPEGPLEVLDVHAEGCKLKWNKPKDDGGLPLDGYTIEKMDTSTSRWVPVGRADKDKLEMTVTDFNLEINVPGPPGLPKITDYDSDFVQLNWETPMNDGGAPINGYIIEKKDKYKVNWISATEIQGNIPQGKVKGLNEGDKYEFRVRAINKAGSGEPSEATPSHLAKSKFLKPRIDQSNLKNVTVKVGQVVNLDVNVIGEPPPKVEWMLNDKILGSSDSYKIDSVDYNTKFSILRATQARKVACKPGRPNGPLEVSNVHKEGCKLKWQEPDDDGGAPIECYEIEKKDEDSGIWVPAGKSIHPNFEIKNLIPEKKYHFRVRAVNKEGDSDELETSLATLAKNPYDEPGKPGRPEPVDWDKDHIDLKWTAPASDGGSPITGYIIEKKKKGSHKWQKGKLLSGDKTTATVTDIEEGDVYELKVIAVNKAGLSEPSDSSKYVVAKPRFLAPYIDRTDLKNVVVHSGQAVRFDVNIKGEPPPNVAWIFNEQQIQSSGHLTIATENYHTQFVLTKAKRKNSGKYTIIAQNDSGKDEVTVDVTIISKPGIPKGPLQVSNVHAEGCMLKWDKPEDDGGEPVQQYLVEKMDIETARWVLVTTTREPEAEVTGLIPSKEYKFRVKAVNSEGESDALETETTVLAKNPYEQEERKLDYGSQVYSSARTLALKMLDPIHLGVYHAQLDELGASLDDISVFSYQLIPPWLITLPTCDLSLSHLKKADIPDWKYLLLFAEHLLNHSSIPVYMNDEPDKPGKPSSKNWDKHFVDLVWSPPKSDGGAPITSYVIEKKDKFSTKWQKATEIIGEKCEARVTDLMENVDYQFRVRAINKAGPGNPSDPSDVITTKPRFLAPKLEKMRDLKVHAGQTIKFNVKVIGEPTPRKSWRLR